MPALCLWPDHVHCVWQLPAGDHDYSARWAFIKRTFSQSYLALDGTQLRQSDSRQKRRELGIWQRRLWEHLIRDADDCANHVHYIHYNPVKHGWVERVEDWPYSTYHRFRQQGVYNTFDWSLFDSGLEETSIQYME